MRHLGGGKCQNSRADRMPCRTYGLLVKVQSWELVVHPCSLREMQGVTRSVKFPDKGPLSGLSKCAGCSVSEPTGSLVTSNRSRRPCGQKGKAATPSRTLTTGTDRWTPGVAGVTRTGRYAGEHGRPCMMSSPTTRRYKETKFSLVVQGVGGAHSTACIPRTTEPWEREGALPSSCFVKKERKRRLQQC